VINSKGELDMGTMNTVANTIREIQKYQANPFPFDENSSPVLPPLIPLLEKLNVITDDEQLYQMSLQVMLSKSHPVQREIPFPFNWGSLL
jgi:hypothetical protein